MKEEFSIESIIERIRNIEISDKLRDIFNWIATGAKKLGRVMTRQLLYLYFVLKEGNLSATEKAWIYAALIYVLVPGDFVPRRVFHLLGLTDDALAVAYVIKKVNNRITPEIELKVAMQLDEWFGYEVS